MSLACPGLPLSLPLSLSSRSPPPSPSLGSSSSPAYDNSPADARIPEWLRATQDPATLLEVEIAAEAMAVIRELEPELQMLGSADEAAACIKEVLETDPRSVYRKTKCIDQLYPLILGPLHMICRFEGRTVTVLKVERLADTEYADEKIGVSNLPTALRSAPLPQEATP